MSNVDTVKIFEPDTFVTAIHPFTGARSENDLSFKEGDIMRIVNTIPKDPQWVHAELNKKQGFIPVNCIERMAWFHGKITREQAEFLLKDKEIGSYLIRESKHFLGDYTLCLKSSDSKIEHYRIKRLQNNASFTIDDEIEFKNLVTLVKYYTKEQDLACLLKTPIKVEKRTDNIDYRSIVKCTSSIIDESAIKFGHEIGTGEFGAVYKGCYNNKDVAIKVIKDPTTIQEFFKEAAVMASLSHPNLIKLIGVVFRDSGKEIYLVTEYMPKGSLLDYLMSRGRNVLTKKELLRFSIHTCDAMNYLEEKGIVHRDLAASNVLISEDDVAKLSDFGSAKKIMDETKNDRVRIKWTAPEAIKKKHYSNKSDMWSFGILLWEIFSYGRVPYPKIPVNDVLSYIEQGNRMEKPDGCPDEIYNLMKHAWHSDSTLRPTFKDTLVKLKEIQALYANSQD